MKESAKGRFFENYHTRIEGINNTDRVSVKVAPSRLEILNNTTKYKLRLERRLFTLSDSAPLLSLGKCFPLDENPAGFLKIGQIKLTVTRKQLNSVTTKQLNIQSVKQSTLRAVILLQLELYCQKVEQSKSQTVTR